MFLCGDNQENKKLTKSGWSFAVTGVGFYCEKTSDRNLLRYLFSRNGTRLLATRILDKTCAAFSDLEENVSDDISSHPLPK